MIANVQQDTTGKYISTLGMPKNDWLSMRRSFIGASEWGAVLEINDYDGPYDVWAQKVLGYEKEFTPEQLEAMEMGLELEPTIGRRFSHKTGAKVRRDNKFRICQMPGYDFLGCSIDRLAVMPTKETAVVEIKTVASNAYHNWDAEVPKTYYAQIQAQMFISKIDKAYFAILIDGRTFKYFEVPYDQEFIDIALPRLKTFWESYVIPEIEPPKTVKQYAAGLVLDATVEVDETGFQLYQRAKEIGVQKSAIEKNYKAVTDRLKEMIGESSGITYQGELLATWKRDRAKMEFDVDQLAIDYPDIFAQYQKPKLGSRRLNLK